MFRFRRCLFGLDSTHVAKTTIATSTRAINEGDFHSGPAGYTPNITYLETKHGSGFDEAADWADGEQ